MTRYTIGVSLIALSLSACWIPEEKPSGKEIPITTDSLSLDILGLELGRTYSEEDLIRTLSLRLGEIKIYPDVRSVDWLRKAPCIVRRHEDNLMYVVRWTDSRTIVETEGFPWQSVYLSFSPDKRLFEISLFQSTPRDGYDMATADSLFRDVTLKYIPQFGQPDYLYWDTSKKYLSFKTWKIEQEGGKVAIDSRWSDGTRKLTFGYLPVISCSFSFSFEDTTIRREIENSKQKENPPKRFRIR